MGSFPVLFSLYRLLSLPVPLCSVSAFSCQILQETMEPPNEPMSRVTWWPLKEKKEVSKPHLTHGFWVDLGMWE